jgi:hypothetical protein
MDDTLARGQAACQAHREPARATLADSPEQPPGSGRPRQPLTHASGRAARTERRPRDGPKATVTTYRQLGIALREKRQSNARARVGAGYKVESNAARGRHSGAQFFIRPSEVNLGIAGDSDGPHAAT